MGRTKALVEVEGRAMADRVLDALFAGGCRPVALLGGDADELERLSAPVWPDAHPGDGPVGGLAEALRRSGDLDRRPVAATMVVACDLPWLRPEVVEQLLIGLTRAPDADACVARSDRREPLCAIWRIETADRVAAAFAHGVRSMHDLLDRFRIVEVAVDPSVVRNVNTPSDVG